MRLNDFHDIFNFFIWNYVVVWRMSWTETFSRISESAADAANGLSNFFINSKPTFINGPRSLPRNLSDSTILDSWDFYNFTLLDELFSKALQRCATCLSVSNDLC